MKIIFQIVLLTLIINVSRLNAQKRNVKLSAADTIPKLELDNFYKYIATHVKYPKTVVEDQIKGVVIATYNIDVNNKIKNIKILRSIDTLLSIEVIKALQGSSPPSIKKQGIVYVLPVYFDMQTDNDLGRDVEKYHLPVYDAGLSKILSATCVRLTEVRKLGYKIRYRQRK
ncbi:hypothetical protein [Mucilaginibacter sp. UYCu711]|uniref:hypothetical protein n=1 Tax=Mucilaginibacter sp. UYCu711 TaxID=3156339 RepID=UPI003D228B86